LWLLARKENVAVAIARGWKLNETDCVLSSLFVHPSQRGHGIAHALIDEVHEWMTNEGAVNSLLRVIDGNEDAARLYESYGYQRTGVYEPLQRDPNTYEAEYALDLSLLAKSA
jgi:GNAT superfamily N-acetyltransferase